MNGFCYFYMLLNTHTHTLVCIIFIGRKAPFLVLVKVIFHKLNAETLFLQVVPINNSSLKAGYKDLRK